MIKCVLIVQLEIPQISNNLFRPSAQIGHLFGIFLKKGLITCPLSMVPTNLSQLFFQGKMRQNASPSVDSVNNILLLKINHFHSNFKNELVARATALIEAGI